MIINVCFDLHASSIECDIDESCFDEASKRFEEWLYEEKEIDGMKCRGIKDSLNIDILDINVVIRFFKEIYPNSNPKLLKDKFDIDDLDLNIPTINL